MASEKPANLFDQHHSGGVSLERLQPDYVISAVYSFDHKRHSPTREANLDLANLLKLLTAHGFLVQIRPGKGVDRILIFVKLRNAALKQAIQDAKVNDFLYNINNDLFSDSTTASDPEEKSLRKRSSGLADSEKLRIIYNLLTNDESDGGLGLTPKFAQWSFIESIQPIHDLRINEALIAKWSKNYTIEESDIELLKHQYGTKIALYFAFLKFYLKWLLFPAFIGLFNFVFLGYKFSVGYTLLNLVWSIFFIQAWKKKEQNYALKWNVKNVNSSTLQTVNQTFRSEGITTNYISDKHNFKYYPSYKRFLKKLAFVPVAASFAGALIGWQFVCFFVELFINELYNGPLKSILALTPAVMLAAFVPILTLIYKTLVTKIVQWENHRTILSYENSVNEKMFVISFLTSYMALFITTFIYFPFGHKVNDYLTAVELFIHTKIHESFPIKVDHYVINATRMNSQFFFSIVTNQVLTFFLEYFLPFLQRKYNEKKEARKGTFFDYNDAADEKEYLIQIRKEVYELGEYDVNDDFRTMIVQFGYLAFFSQCWTIAPLICLVVNYIQFIGDTTKIFLENKRPIPTRTNSIYPWNQFLGLLVWLSSIIAPAITSMYRQSDNILGKVDSLVLVEKRFRESSVSIQSWSLLSVIIFSEHVYLLLSYVLGILYSKISTEENKKDLKESILIKKRFISNASNIDNLTNAAVEEFGTSPAIENQWVQLGGDDNDTLIDLAARVTQNVKEITRVKRTSASSSKPVPAPQPVSRPVAQAPVTGNAGAPADASPAPQQYYNNQNEFIDEKIGGTGASVTGEAANELSQRRGGGIVPETTAAVKEAYPRTAEY